VGRGGGKRLFAWLFRGVLGDRRELSLVAEQQQIIPGRYASGRGQPVTLEQHADVAGYGTYLPGETLRFLS
jgi:hypothetical protein